MALVQKFVPAPTPADRDLALVKAQDTLVAMGVTAAADMGTTIEDWQALRRAGDAGALRVRTISYADGVDAMQLIGGPGPTRWLYGDRLRLNGVKLYLDGALGSRGAWLKRALCRRCGQYRPAAANTDTAAQPDEPRGAGRFPACHPCHRRCGQWRSADRNRRAGRDL